MTTPTEQQIKTSIAALRHEIPARLRVCRGSVTFYAHLSIGVIAAGGLGIWNTFFQTRWLGWHWDNFAGALYTYFPAVVAAAALDCQKDERAYWRSVGMLALVPFGAVFAFSTLSQSEHLRFGWAVVGSLLAALFWTIANGDNDCFKDFDPDAPTPPPSTKMIGNKSGWQTT